MVKFTVAPLFLLFASCVVANQSLVLLPGETAKITIPAVAPLTTLGDTRLELRVNYHAAPKSASTIFQHSGFTVLLYPSGEICGLDYIDSMPDYGNQMCADVSAIPDFVLRMQRATATKQLQMEVHSVSNNITVTAYCGSKAAGSTGNVMPCPIRTVNYSSWAGSATLGGSQTDVQVAWLKWYSYILPVGAGSFSELNPADLADWRFESGTDNVGSSGLAITIGPLQSAPNPAGADPAVMFAPTPALPPVCNAGALQVFRAGYPAQLDGAWSYPVDGGASLQYAWQQISGPSTVQFADATAAQPGITGLVFGSYVFQLTVTDGSSQSATCTVKHGAVATDSNNVVITGNPPVDALIGPQIRFGANPWPWFDNRAKAAADMQIADLDPYYSSYWDTPGAGTVSVTAGSNTVTGFGTTFTTTFCQGSANPTVPKNIHDGTPAILVWYPSTDPGQTGRRGPYITSCQSDTSLTMNTAWASDVSGGTNLNYSYTDDVLAGNWISNASPANFYDNVAAFYILYYRTGLDDYLAAARKLADRFWASPRIDRGAACGPHSPGLCTAPRNLSLLGLVLRALDGRNDMWPGMRLMWDYFKDYDLSGLDVAQTSIWDLREEAYHLQFVSECALVDPDPVHRAACKTVISQSFPKIWTPFLFPDGSWAQLYYGGMGGGSSSWDSRSSVTLTNGSNAVIGNGTIWTAGTCAASSGGCTIWFTNGTGKPASNAEGDNTTYNAVTIDATHITLDRPYAGTTGVHGWAITNPQFGLIGWGSQPFMMGIMGTAFDMAARAIADSDPSTAALAHSYNVTAANWIKNYSYWPLRKGLYYGVGFINCQLPISDTSPPCTENNDASQARTLNAETMRAVGAAYAYSGDSSMLAFGDTLFSAMFSKPGTGGPNPDGSYVSDWDDTLGWYMSGTPPTGKAPKYFGMFFGTGDGSSWPAYRLASGTPGGNATAYVPVRNIGGIRVRITTLAPDGHISRRLCGGSRCAVDYDPRQGEHLITIEYLGDGDRVISSERTVINRTAK